MTISSLKEARKRNAESGLIFGNPDHFGEAITFYPAGGAPRTIVAACAGVELSEVGDEVSQSDQELLWVGACKDPACARGGIAAPAVGDSMLRAGDAADARWSFQERIRRETPHDWELLFGRIRPRRYGPK